MFSLARHPVIRRTIPGSGVQSRPMPPCATSIARPRMIQREGRSRDPVRPTPDECTQLRRVLEIAAKNDPLHEHRVAWARSRQTRIRIDPMLWKEPPNTSDSTLAPPWRTVTVPRQTLRELIGPDYPYTRGPAWPCLSSLIGYWGIGSGRAAANCNPLDVRRVLDEQIRSRVPGQGPFNEVVRGPYGERYCKYLYVIDHEGMHIVREMTPCDFSSRGIALHSLMRDEAIVGGEIFFDAGDPGKVIINFGSARYPVTSNHQAERIAEFVLSIGYQTVVAAIPQREFLQGEYGLADRYGKDVANVVFVAEPDADTKR